MSVEFRGVSLAMFCSLAMSTSVLFYTFIAATADNYDFHYFRRGSVIVQGMVGSITCVAAHPLLPRLAVLCDSGDIHLWDYDLKVSKRTQLFTALRRG